MVNLILGINQGNRIACFVPVIATVKTPIVPPMPHESETTKLEKRSATHVWIATKKDAEVTSNKVTVDN